jgi:hypothetical protein
MIELSPMKKRFKNVSDLSGTLSCWTIKILPTSKSLTWIWLGYQPAQEGPLKGTLVGNRSEEETGKNWSLVTSGTKALVSKRKRTVEGITCATGVESVDTKEATAARLLVETKSSKHPKYLQNLIWFNTDKWLLVSPTANCTLFDDPLPRPLKEEFDNIDALTTIKDNPDLFKIVTPINVNHFEQLLESHANQPFVKSVCVALWERFWPWAHTKIDSHPGIRWLGIFPIDH